MCFISFNHTKEINCKEIPPYKSLKINDLEIRFHKKIDEITPPQYKCCSDIFLSYDFLKVLELAPPHGFKFCYLSFYKKGDFVGFSACEIKHFEAAKSLNFEDEKPSLWLTFRKWLAEKVSFQTLIVGNLLLTGEHSYFFENELITDSDKSIFIKEGVILAKKILTEENIFIKSTFIKDFFESQKTVENTIHDRLTTFGEGYNEFQVEPNFIFEIDPDWYTFDDYMEALASKYRVRAKRAFKKMNGIDKKEFNTERIIANKFRINELYKNICSKSSFNLVELNANYFIEMKRQLDSKFTFWGFTASQEDNNLVGFLTTIDNGDELEAHYLGYDEKYNNEHQLYLNFLFEIIKIGIEKKKKRIVFSRTAHEIKSSVGAQAHEMYLYMKHDNRIINSLLPYFLRILSPREKWLPRQPFKSVVQNSTNS